MKMSPIIFKSLPFLPIGRKTLIYSSSPPLIRLRLLSNHVLQRNLSSSSSSSSSTEQKDGAPSFTFSYLVNSCGLSPEVAVSMSEKLNLHSPEKPDSVIALLRNHGFADSHISILVTRRPSLLRSDPKKTLLPKLEFFRSIGVPIDELAAILSTFTHHLAASLEKQIRPMTGYLRTLIGSDEKFVYVFKQSARCTYAARRNIPKNVETLKQCGVSKSSIAFLASYHLPSVCMRNEKFNQIVDKVTRMGFDPSKLTFVNAVQVFAEMSESTIQRKFNAYRRWGLSDDDIVLAFKRHPICMSLSEKKIDSTMDFLVNEMGCQASVVVRNPVILFFSLEKRIKPRCLVGKFLMLKSLMKNPTSLRGLLFETEREFMDKYVKKYKDDVPQLLDVYDGKIDLLELGFGEEETGQVKLI